MFSDLIDHINLKHGNVLSYYLLSGGDISSVFKIKTVNGDLVAKIGNGARHKALLTAEKNGLNLLKNQDVIAIPEIYDFGSLTEMTFLLMEYIPAKSGNVNEMLRLGGELANLHQCLGKTYGGDQDNFIGSLPQSNIRHSNWAEFYVDERLVPQFKLAVQKRYIKQEEIPEVELMTNKIKTLTNDVQPTLLHGDLWNGNYLIHENGTPYLIDPAVYYGHSGVDIAMTKLFGGFSHEFYSAYHDVIPISLYDKSLTDLYQLYYLLAHLNMFGMSYKGSVMSIVSQHFK